MLRCSARPTVTATLRGSTTWCGSAYTVVACSPTASWTPVRSYTAPRPAGTATCSRCCLAASRDSERAWTPWSHIARSSVAANATTKIVSSSRIRRFASFGLTAPAAPAPCRSSGTDRRERGPGESRAPGASVRRPRETAPTRGPRSWPEAGRAARRRGRAGRSGGARRRSSRRLPRAGSRSAQSRRARRRRRAGASVVAYAYRRNVRAAAEPGPGAALRPSLPRPRTPSGLDGSPQPRRGGPRVRRHLGRARTDRPPRERPQRRLTPADANRELGRADAPALLRAQEPLHDPVLERVEADHREPAAWLEQLERRG